MDCRNKIQESLKKDGEKSQYYGGIDKKGNLRLKLGKQATSNKNKIGKVIQIAYPERRKRRRSSSRRRRRSSRSRRRRSSRRRLSSRNKINKINK